MWQVGYRVGIVRYDEDDSSLSQGRRGMGKRRLMKCRMDG